MYRKFWLQNSKEEKYFFTEKNSKSFLSSPSGLGFVGKYSVTDLGSSQIVNSENYSLTDITGELLFYNSNNDNRYQDYYDFISFIKHKPLEFHYLPSNSVEDFYCDVVFTQADKGESSSTGVLSVPVVFHRLTQWLTSNDYVMTLRNETSGSGKNYDLERPYHYSGSTLSDVSIFNNGTESVGFTFEITGDVTNPQFSLLHNGQTYGICKIVGSYDYVKVNSVETEEEIYLENDGSSIANATSYQDLSVANGDNYVTFVKLQVGENKLNFTCANIDTFNGTITIRFKHSYISV